MDKPTFINVDFELLTHSSYLGEGAHLPYSDELKEALQLVSSACHDEVKRREKEVRENWLIQKYHQLKELFNKKHDGQEARKILNEIADYEVERKKALDIFR
jgi:hypothetical protein